jgi:AI-2 transport protein TqsA
MNETQRAPRLTPAAVIAIVLIIASLHWLRALVVPVAFALFLIALVWPLQMRLETRAARPLAVALSGLVVLVATVPVIFLVSYGIGLVGDGIAQYGARMEATYLALGAWLERRGIALWPVLASELPSWTFHAVHEAATRINAVAGFLALTIIFLILGLLEVDDVRKRLAPALGDQTAGRLIAASREIGWKFRRYMLVRTAVSAPTGLLTWLFALLVGLEFAIVWGGLAFVLNYVPVVGSILAVIPPVLFAFVQFESWQIPLLVLAGMGVIQFSIGNLLDPRLEGRILALSPFVVVVSIFFWGLVWGIPGAFIGVPLTLAIATVCNQFHEACWIARLLTPEHSAHDAENDAGDHLV